MGLAEDDRCPSAIHPSCPEHEKSECLFYTPGIVRRSFKKLDSLGNVDYVIGRNVFAVLTFVCVLGFAFSAFAWLCLGSAHFRQLSWLDEATFAERLAHISLNFPPNFTSIRLRL